MKLVSIKIHDIKRCLLGLFISTLCVAFFNNLNAQCTEYTGQTTIGNGDVYCVSSDLSLNNGFTIEYGGELIVKPGVTFDVSGTINVYGTLTVKNGAGVNLNGSFIVGEFWSDNNATVFLEESSFLTFTGALTQNDPSLWNTAYAQIVMADHSLVEICGNFKQGSTDYPFIKYNGSGKDAYFVVKNNSIGESVWNWGGPDNISELSDSSNIVWIAMGEVTDFSANIVQYCGDNATETNCSLWPEGLTTGNCSDAPNIIDNLTSKADLEISTLIHNSDGTVEEGDQVTFTIGVKNNGPDDVTNAAFAFDWSQGFQTSLAQISFNGNACGTSGSENIDTISQKFEAFLNLPVGCEVFYTLTFTATANVSLGTNEFIASVSPPSSVEDTELTNNTKIKSLLYTSGCFVSVEGSEFDWYYSSGSGQVNKIITQPSSTGGFTFDIYVLDNSFNMKINGVKLASEEIQFQSAGLGPNAINVKFLDGDRYTIEVPQIHTITGSANNPLIRVIIDPMGAISLYGSKSSGGVLYPLVLFNGNSFNNITWNTSGSNEIAVTQKITGPTSMTGSGYGVNVTPCTYALTKEGVFNDINGNGYAEAGETITYTFVADNLEDVPISNLKINDPLLGGAITVNPMGDSDTDGVLDVTETWMYVVDYTITETDLNNEGVYNRASITGTDAVNNPYAAKESTDPTAYTVGEFGYDSARPYHTYVHLVSGHFMITNPMIRQMLKN